MMSDMGNERPGDIERPRDRAEAVAWLEQRALDEIDAMHGPTGPEPLQYHNRRHAEEWIDAACQMADTAIAAGKLSPSDKDLLRLAGAYHDWERGRGKDNEQVSADLLVGRMKASRVFSDDEMQLCHQMIMTTEVAFKDGRMFHPNEPQNLMMAIAADADLAALGKEPETCWDHAYCLLQEQSGNDEPGTDRVLEFAREQITFLDNHRFYTEEAVTCFPHREDNIVYMQQLVAELEAA